MEQEKAIIMNAKILKNILPLCLLAMLLGAGCTKNNYIDTGVSQGRHDCSLLEYMEKHPYDSRGVGVVVRTE